MEGCWCVAIVLAVALPFSGPAYSLSWLDWALVCYFGIHCFYYLKTFCSRKIGRKRFPYVLVRKKSGDSISCLVLPVRKAAGEVGDWVAQLVKCQTLGFSLGHTLRVVGLSPVSGSILSAESAWDSLLFSLPPLISCDLSLFLQNPSQHHLLKAAFPTALAWVRSPSHRIFRASAIPLPKPIPVAQAPSVWLSNYLPYSSVKSAVTAVLFATS